MATLDKSHHVDLEAGGGHRPSTAVSGGLSSRSSNVGESSVDERKSSSLCGTEIVGVSDKRRESSVSECSVEVDLEAGVHENKVHLEKPERDCRICHLSLDVANQESGIPIELGCSCKDDLAAAHKHCAEAWFKIKGDKYFLLGNLLDSISVSQPGPMKGSMTSVWSLVGNALPSVPNKRFSLQHLVYFEDAV